MNEKETEDQEGLGDHRKRFLVSIESYMGELRSRLAEAPRGKLTDAKELRMLTSVVMRSYDIWAKALATGAKDESLAKLERLRKIFRETVGGLDQA